MILVYTVQSFGELVKSKVKTLSDTGMLPVSPLIEKDYSHTQTYYQRLICFLSILILSPSLIL
jgi:hypothetical protein